MEKNQTNKHTAFNSLAVSVLILIGLVVYADSLPNSFVWDDENLVLGNPAIRSLPALPELFTGGIFIGIKGNFYRPLQSLTYAADYAVWGLNPLGYHLTNILIHIINAILVYFILFFFTSRGPVSFITSLIFLIHPVQTEAVSYISGRADLLSAFFVFLSLLFFLIEKKRLRSNRAVWFKKSGWLILSVLFFLLALLAKEAALILPFLVLLCDVTLRKKPAESGEGRHLSDPAAGWYYGFFFLIILFYAAARYIALRSGAIPITSNPYPFYARFLTGWKVVLLYVKVLIFPFHLRMERLIPLATTFFSPPVLLAGGVISGTAVCLAKAYRRSSLVFFGIAWFFLALLPYMNWFPLNAEMADHWLYLPSVGFFLLIAISVEKIIIRGPKNLSSAPPWRGTTISNLPGTRGSKNSLIGCALLLAIIVSLAALTIRRNLDWKDNKTIYRATARTSPGSPRARYNLGNIYLAEGRLDEAVGEYRESLRIKPRDARCRGNLGKALLELNRIPEAVREFETAVSLQPEAPSTLTKLGAAYGLAGRPHDAVRVLERSIALDSSQPDAYNNLGSVYTRLGRYSEAVPSYREALKLKPGMIEAVFNLGVVYYYQERLDEAEKRMEEALRLDPNFTRAHIWRDKIKEREGVVSP